MQDGNSPSDLTAFLVPSMGDCFLEVERGMWGEEGLSMTSDLGDGLRKRVWVRPGGWQKPATAFWRAPTEYVIVSGEPT